MYFLSYSNQFKNFCVIKLTNSFLSKCKIRDGCIARAARCICLLSRKMGLEDFLPLDSFLPEAPELPPGLSVRLHLFTSGDLLQQVREQQRLPAAHLPEQHRQQFRGDRGPPAEHHLHVSSSFCTQFDYNNFSRNFYYFW